MLSNKFLEKLIKFDEKSTANLSLKTTKTDEKNGHISFWDLDRGAEHSFQDRCSERGLQCSTFKLRPPIFKTFKVPFLRSFQIKMLSSVAYPKVPPNLKGVKHSRTANTTSLGLECLDKLFDDGIPLPSIILIDEKGSRKISKLLQRLFAAEGITHEQNVVVASPRKQELDDFLNSIPSETASSSSAASGTSATGARSNAMVEENLKIAWRYQSAPQISSSITTSKPKFDLGKSRMKMDVDNSGLIQTVFANTYDKLWKELEVILNSVMMEATQQGSKNPVRIIISGLGSPLFLDHSKASLTNFIVRLRAFTMASLATVMITVDGAQLESEVLESLHLVSDSVLNFFPTPERLLRTHDSTAFAGRLEVAKLPRLYGNSLFRPEFCDYSYKDTRHTIEVRKLHLDFDDGNEVDSKAVEPITDDLREMGILAPDADDD